MSDENADQPEVFRFDDGESGVPAPKKRRSAPDSAESDGAEDPEPGDELAKRESDADTVTRARAAVNLRVYGTPYIDIATTLGYASASAARQAVERALANVGTEQDWQSLRAITSARLEGLMQSLAERALNATIKVQEEIKYPDGTNDFVTVEKVNEEHLAYAGRFLQVVDRHAKLHGIDAPQVITMVDPNVEEFERTVKRLVDVARSGESPEADPIEMQLGADGETWEESDDDDDEAHEG